MRAASSIHSLKRWSTIVRRTAAGSVAQTFFGRQFGLHVDGSAGGEALQWIAAGERKRVLNSHEFDSVQLRVEPHRLGRQR